MPIRPLVLAAAALAGAAHAETPAGKPVMSTPIDSANAATVAELIRLTDAIDAAVDAKDWPAARALFAERVAVDFQSLSGQPPATVTADSIITGWRTNLTPAKTSQHHRSNHQVTLIDADTAEVRSVGHAWNRMEGNGDPLWEVWGHYTHRFSRTAAGWRCTAMTLKVTHQRGNSWVRDTVPER